MQGHPPSSRGGPNESHQRTDEAEYHRTKPTTTTHTNPHQGPTTATGHTSTIQAPHNESHRARRSSQTAPTHPGGGPTHESLAAHAHPSHGSRAHPQGHPPDGTSRQGERLADMGRGGGGGTGGAGTHRGTPAAAPQNPWGRP